MRSKRTILWLCVAAVVAVSVPLALRLYRWRPRFTTLQGAVIRRDDDARNQLPIADVVVTASRGGVSASAHSDASGYFRITFPEVIWPGQTVDLTFRHDNYTPLDLHQEMTFRSTWRRLIIASMQPIPSPVTTPVGKPLSVVSNIRVRYTVNATSEDNIGSAVKTFQVANQGNVPCRRKAPCSPDGAWKATRGSVTLDAGASNEYRNVRTSCIAGPCPFTRIEATDVQQKGRVITVSALNWSDTATFLFEAEVFRTAIRSNARQSYPVIYGETLNFTLPPSAEGVSIEAELDGSPMVFPLGPELYLSWATCTARTTAEAEQSTVYRCELKPGYRF